MFPPGTHIPIPLPTAGGSPDLFSPPAIHNTLSRRNFPGPQNPEDFGLLFADKTDEPKLRQLLRRMRHFNPVPNKGGDGTYRQIPLTTLVEDPVHRDSRHSYFIQLADVNA